MTPPNKNQNNRSADQPDWPELLSAYVDGELTGAQRDAVEARLKADAQARALLHELQAVSDTLRSLPAASAPRDLQQDVLQAARQRTLSQHPSVASQTAPIGHRAWPSLGRSPRGWLWAAAAIAAAVLVMIANPQKEDAQLALSKPHAGAATPSSGLAGEPAADLASSAPHPELRALPDSIEREASSLLGRTDESAEESSASPAFDLPDMAAAESSDSVEAVDSFSGIAGRRASGGGAGAGGRRRTKSKSESFNFAPNKAVVVRLDMRPEAFDNRLVDHVLGNNGIPVQPTPAVLVNTFNYREKSPSHPRGALADNHAENHASDNRASSAALAGQEDHDRNLALGTKLRPSSQRHQAAANKPVDIVLVDAPIPPVIDAVSELNRDRFNCVSIQVEPAPPAPAPPAYNEFQRQVVQNRKLVENQRAIDSLGVYSRSGIGPEQAARPGARQQAQTLTPPGGQQDKSYFKGRQQASQRGVAYRYQPQDELAEDKADLYSQLNLFANETLRYVRATESPPAHKRHSGKSASGPAPAQIADEDFRVPVVFLLQCASAPQTPAEAAPTAELPSDRTEQ